jgi:hypothetical protein
MEGEPVSVIINLPAETESKLKALAASTGQALDDYLRGLIEEAISREVTRTNGTRAAEGEAKGKTWGEIVVPLQEAFRESGTTEAEFDDLVEQARDEVWRERQAGKRS